MRLDQPTALERHLSGLPTVQDICDGNATAIDEVVILCRRAVRNGLVHVVVPDVAVLRWERLTPVAFVVGATWVTDIEETP
ncbi:MAG: hypothetical protein ACI8RZ_003769 [Myxococcota bacterium]|jgi:hypothetical protein